MFIKYLLTALLLCGIGFAAKADQGCYTGDGYIYYQYKTEVSGYSAYKKSTTNRVSFNSTFCQEVEDLCKVEKNLNSSSYDWGLLYTFYFVDCPLDDHIGTLLAISAGVGLFYLRKRKINTHSF